MKISWSEWEKFGEEMQPYIDKAYRNEIPFKEFDEILKQKMINLKEEHSKNKLELVGWLGGDYDYFGFYDDKDDAERGHLPTERFYELIGDEFKGKKVKITVEIIE